jgi:hypothetical protein
MGVRLGLSLLSEDHRYTICKNQVPRRMFALEREEVRGERRKLHPHTQIIAKTDLPPPPHISGLKGNVRGGRSSRNYKLIVKLVLYLCAKYPVGQICTT